MGRSFALGGVQDSQLLIDYGAPATWVADITAACDAWEADMGQQDSAVGTRVGKGAELTAKRDEFMQLKRTVDHMVPNYCASDISALAAWDSASHVELPPKAKVVTP